MIRVHVTTSPEGTFAQCNRCGPLGVFDAPPQVVAKDHFETVHDDNEEIE